MLCILPKTIGSFLVFNKEFYEIESVSTTLGQCISEKYHWNKARKSIICGITGFVRKKTLFQIWIVSIVILICSRASKCEMLPNPLSFTSQRQRLSFALKYKFSDHCLHGSERFHCLVKSNLFFLPYAVKLVGTCFKSEKNVQNCPFPTTIHPCSTEVNICMWETLKQWHRKESGRMCWQNVPPCTGINMS